MNHLKLIGHVDIAPVLPALIEHAALFDEATWRQDHPASPHHATRSIYLRMPLEITIASVFEGLGVVNYPAMRIEPFADLVTSMARELREPKERVARVMLVELAGYSGIPLHIDEGAYAGATERYHLAITTNRLCEMWVDRETAHMQPGEVWWFNKHALHGVVNFGGDPRVHLIMDVFA